MIINLPAELEKFIQDQLDQGCFKSRDEVIKEALMLMQKHRKITVSDDFNRYKENLNQKLEEGLEDVKHGRLVSGEEAFQRLQAKLEAWSKEKS